jgi:uncharacterized membrane protein YfcA
MMLLEFALPIFLILFFAALAAGYMDTLAGVDGLITLPALMLCIVSFLCYSRIDLRYLCKLKTLS